MGVAKGFDQDRARVASPGRGKERGDDAGQPPRSDDCARPVMFRQRRRPAPEPAVDRPRAGAERSQEVFREQLEAKRREFVDIAQAQVATGAAILSDEIEKKLENIIDRVPGGIKVRPLIKSSIQVALAAALEGLLQRHPRHQVSRRSKLRASPAAPRARISPSGGGTPDEVGTRRRVAHEPGYRQRLRHGWRRRSCLWHGGTRSKCPSARLSACHLQRHRFF